MRVRWSLLVLVGFLAVPALAADPAPMLVRSAEGATLLEQGRDLMIALRLDEAERAFERLARAEPQSPAAAKHLAKIAWWRAITLEQDDLYEAFFARSDALIEALDAAGRGPWTSLFRGETELHRSAIHAKRNEHMRAAMALRRAYQHFRRNAREHPEFHESSWGMGLCYVAVGSVPRSFRWVLRVLGYRGTVSGGMADIERSMQRSRYYRDEAAIYFAILDDAINESKMGGFAHLRAVHARHPDSPATLYLIGFSLLSERRAADAETMLRRAEAATRAPGVFAVPHVQFYLGQALFRQNRFEEAVVRFERFLEDFPGQALKPQAALHAGLSREMLGDREAAVRHYRRVEARTDYDADASALREASILLRGPMSARQRELLIGRNAYDGGRYAEAISAVQTVLGDRSAPAVERAEAAYRSGRAYQAMEQWSEALRHFQFAVSNPGDPLAKWGPWSQLYIGQVHEARGDGAAARQAYQQALAYDVPFEYHKGLEQRARAALERL